jgi:exodeoxyribonuclease-5
LDILPRGKVNQWSYDMILVGTNRTRHRINDDFRDEQGFYDLPPQPGEPMILLRNDHERKICNGDVFEVRAIEHDDDDDEVIWITGLFDDGRELMFPAKIEDVQHGADMAGEAAPVAFAYAITAHKSQGSEWRDVLVVDESKVFGLDAKRWLYTAATRAREHLAIVRRI